MPQPLVQEFLCREHFLTSQGQTHWAEDFKGSHMSSAQLDKLQLQSSLHVSSKKTGTDYLWFCSFCVIIFPNSAWDVKGSQWVFNEYEGRWYKSRKPCLFPAIASEILTGRIQWLSSLDNSSSWNSKVKQKGELKEAVKADRRRGLYLPETEMSLQMGWRWSVWLQPHVDTDFSKNTTCLLTQTRVYVMTFPTYYQLPNVETLRSTFF